jgi:hypothetical protein
MAVRAFALKTLPIHYNVNTLKTEKKHAHQFSVLITAKAAKYADAGGCVKHSFEVSLVWNIQFI